MTTPLEILIVDDSPAFNQLTRLTIKKSGLECNITELSNGLKALEYLAVSNSCPDVILLDINMPVMDGFDFLEEYTRDHKCLNKSFVYMLTSSAEERDKANAKAFDIVKGYFEKPISKENIAAISYDIEQSRIKAA